MRKLVRILGSAAVMAALFGAVLGLLTARPAFRDHAVAVVHQAGPTATPSDEPVETVDSAPGAVAIAQQYLPPDAHAYDFVARLVTREVADTWRGRSMDGTDPATPVWLVGMRTTGATLHEVLFQFGTPPPADPLVDGAFFVINASAGTLASMGVLEEGTSHSHSSLASIPSMSLTIPVITAISLDPLPYGWPTPMDDS